MSLIVIKYFTNIFFKVSSFTSAIKVPSFAIDIFPVSSETTTATQSVSFEIPIAALCLVPNSLAISLSSANGSIHDTAAILLSLITTAPSWSGVLGVKIFTSNCGEISESSIIPESIISFSFMSLSITINAPVLVLASSVAAITIL